MLFVTSSSPAISFDHAAINSSSINSISMYSFSKLVTSLDIVYLSSIAKFGSLNFNAPIPCSSCCCLLLGHPLFCLLILLLILCLLFKIQCAIEYIKYSCCYCCYFYHPFDILTAVIIVNSKYHWNHYYSHHHHYPKQLLPLAYNLILSPPDNIFSPFNLSSNTSKMVI